MAAGGPVDAPPASFGGAERPTFEELLAAPVRWPRPSRLEAPLGSLKGIGPKLAAAAARAGVSTVSDLLWRVPRAYRDPAGRLPVAELAQGQDATLLVEVRSARRVRVRKRGLSVIEARVFDDSGEIKATWFNRPWMLERLTPGATLVLEGRFDRRGFNVREHQFVGGSAAAGEAGEGSRWRPGAEPPGIADESVMGAHSATEELRPSRWRSWAWAACGLAQEAVEALPAEIRARRRLPGAADAFRAAHFPGTQEEAGEAIERLAYEELFLHQVALLERRRARRDAAEAAVRAEPPGELVGAWLESLPFEPTGDQRRAMRRIDADLASGRPMQRLLMGEVGSGKTVVALYAMLRAVESGAQAALMAPTETLAEQHARTIETLLAGVEVRFGLLTGSVKGAGREAFLEGLASGGLAIAVGTHALIEPRVRFARLALCVVDEEHRFGVRQRSVLDGKAPPGTAAHSLHMTATPIPRTLSMTAYGDLDTTELREMPAGRLPVETQVVPESQRHLAFELVRDQLDAGRQAFVVCPLVEGSGSVEARAAEQEFERLGEGELAGRRLGLLHGRMAAEEKSRVMGAFASGEIEALVCTTVIEVGVDVPNATAMVVEGAERFGLSQLHQLRGRVGRGEHGGVCVLVSSSAGELARRRLATVASTSDGFRLAEADLEIRGEGEALGTRQSGVPRFAVARLPEDAGLLGRAREDALELDRRYGSFAAPALGPLAGAALARLRALRGRGGGAEPDREGER